jgi:LPXTG-site transpeptidase (sortase) family protein
MKHKLIATGIVSPLLLAMCVAAVLLMSLAGWLILRPEHSPRAIRKVATVGPLLPAAMVTPATSQSAELIEAAESQPLSEPQAEAVGIERDSQPLEVAQAPSPTPDVEEVLGFSLPPNTVNSVTQQGAATRLVIPKLNLDAPVLLAPIENQTWRVSHLGQAVGHLEGTAPPGSDSNIVLAGHVTLAAGVYGPFAGLAQLATGDLVIVYEGDQKFQYVVDGYQTVERTAVEVTHPTETGQITLITCSNWNGEAGRYDQRIVVRGHLAPE